MRSAGAVALTLLVTAVLGGCGDDGGGPGALPGREPEVTGTVERDDADVRLVEASDDYYDRMSLLDDDAVIVRASDGAVVDETALVDGVAVEVWVGGACAESYPVQCGLEAIRVDDAP